MSSTMLIAKPFWRLNGKPYGNRTSVPTCDMALHRFRSSVAPGEKAYVVDREGRISGSSRSLAREFGAQLGTLAADGQRHAYLAASPLRPKCFCSHRTRSGRTPFLDWPFRPSLSLFVI